MVTHGNDNILICHLVLIRVRNKYHENIEKFNAESQRGEGAQRVFDLAFLSLYGSIIVAMPKIELLLTQPLVPPRLLPIKKRP